MSSILEEAVIHANTLREAAIKNAEQIVIEKYSSDIKDAVEKLLEGTEEVMQSIPYAHEELLTTEETSKPVELPLKDVTGKDELKEELDIDIDNIKSLLGESSEEDDDEDGEEESALKETQMSPDGDYEEESLYEVESFDDEEEDEGELEEGDIYHFGSNIHQEEEDESNLGESIHFDTKVVPTGWMGANQATLGEAELVDMVARIAKESMEEERKAHKEEVKKAQKEKEAMKAKLDESNKKLNQLTQVVQSLKDKLVESNTTNGKLFYTNCVLKDPSLNERQKEKLVENLSKAESLEQAKVIYETLNSVGSTNNSVQKPKSLSEAINRNSSLVVSPRRTEERKDADPVSDRWKRLAGL
jgi:hypothetical protein